MLIYRPSTFVNPGPPQVGPLSRGIVHTHAQDARPIASRSSHPKNCENAKYFYGRITTFVHTMDSRCSSPAYCFFFASVACCAGLLNIQMATKASQPTQVTPMLAR